MIKYDISSIKESIDNIFTIQQQILDILQTQQSLSNVDNYFDETNIMFHINEDVDLDNMEHRLFTKPAFKKRVVINNKLNWYYIRTSI